MNQSSDRPASAEEPPADQGVPRAALAIVNVLLVLEALAVAGVLVWLVVDLLTLAPSSYATAVALIVLVAIGAVFTAAVAVASIRRAGWSRAGAIVWQVLQVSVAAGAFQGLFARPDIGWALLIPAIVVVVLMLAPSVRRAYGNAGAAPEH
ncbi:MULTISPECIES: hypothetical protein [Agromyces]|uniref:Uncharacterized protein n=2 Tax=Agromyces TaxID=33877 RepID=A0A918KV54_AGRME|nr:MULTISPECIES: hypothetical protein [Agromyces]UOE25978.1 hypothetical protein MTP13_16965 [Agromyces soli]GGR34836.1 hypothetical protein GCM10010196_31200 [Agromyces mediolanus]GLJ74170.1 hypothetical protein GCM10017583_34290 [Agromyces mediolanus]GLU90591.1 hypothetical protein Agsp01_28460 [Agromyces sp. NBRC 114283]